MGLKDLIKKGITRKYNTRYEKELLERYVDYHDWISGVESDYGSGSENIPAGSDSKDIFVMFCNPAGRVSDNGREWIGEWFMRFPEALIIYGDEDVWESEKRTAPYFKPDWSPDLFDSFFYPGGVVAVRRSWLEECKDEAGVRIFGSEMRLNSEECQRIVHRLVELAGGYDRNRGRHTILHIPRILFHNKSEADRDSRMLYPESMLDNFRNNLTVGRRLLSIVIPSKDNPELLEKCIKSIFDTAADIHYEIIVVDNGSKEAQRKRIEAVLTQARRSGAPGLSRLLYHYEEMEFNFSKMCNHGVRKSSGDLILFLNDDVELEEDGCLKTMAELAIRPYTGAVGLKLLYPDDKAPGKIQHAGINNLPMGPVHKLQFISDEEDVYFGRNRGRHNVLAVTAACLMVEKAKFQEAGGFDENLRVAFNDVDLCFKLYELGYDNVCECGQFAFHDESYSRGDDDSPEKLARLLEERAKLYDRHAHLEGVDPYYSIYLNRDGLDTRIRPIYETAGNKIQYAGQSQGTELRIVTAKEMAEYRQDPCLAVRVESVLEENSTLEITGWSVVLGDNNACYDLSLIFMKNLPEDTDEEIRTEIRGVYLERQYRPDLVENMPDQINVGLCGYMTGLAKSELSPGKYRLGIMAKSKITSTKLINWSNRVLEI